MKQNKVVFLEGNKTILRPYDERTDLDHFVTWVNDESIRLFMGSFLLPWTRVAEQKAMERHGKHTRDDIFLVLEDKESGACFGTMGIHRIDWLSRFGTTGALIGNPKFRGKGFGTDAKMALLRYAFHTLNLRQIWSSVLAINGRSHAYLKKTGYVETGRFPERHYRNGVYVDEVIMLATPETFAPVWEDWQKQ